jgi:hypothetical protein
MASAEAIGTVLALLHEYYPNRPLSPNTLAAWRLAFVDIPDADLSAAVMLVAKQPGRTFFPTPGEIFAVLTEKIAPPPTEELLRSIQQLGFYTPQHGWINPRVDAVRECFGDAIASAYGYVGPGRLYSDNDTTREIARRDFGLALLDAMDTPAAWRQLRSDTQHKLPPSHES